MLRASLLCFLITASSPAWSLKLKDLYSMDKTHRAWYLGGLYDATLIQWKDNNIKGNCIEKMGFNGYTALISKFIKDLPTDSQSAERKAYDSMNVASVSWMLIGEECK